MKHVRDGLVAVAVSGFVVAGAVVAIEGSQPASAVTNDVVLGSTSAAGAGIPCSDAATVVQYESSDGDSYTLPADGALTSFNFQANDVAGQVRLLVFRPTATANTYQLVGKSPYEDTTVNQLNTYPGLDIQGQQGDVLGLQTSEAYMACGFGDTVTAHALAFSFDAYDADQGNDFVATYSDDTDEVANVSAVFVATSTPDPTPTMTPDPTPTGPTLTQPPATPATMAADTTAPDTILTRFPSRRMHKRLAEFTFKSDESRVTFQCSIDGHAFRYCTSEVAQNFDRGRHTFEVRAVDAAGNVDPTPAKASWRFVPVHAKHKHHHHAR